MKEPKNVDANISDKKNEYDYTDVFNEMELFARKENLSPEKLWWFMKLGTELTSNIAALLFKIK